MVRQPPPRMALATLGLTLRVNLKTHSHYEKLSLSCDQHNWTFIHESKTVIDKFSTDTTCIYCGMMTMMYFHPYFYHYRVCQTHPCGFLLSFYYPNYILRVLRFAQQGKKKISPKIAMALAIFGVKPKVARAILGVKLFTKQSEGRDRKSVV
mgnify:CR=1 FL=1